MVVHLPSIKGLRYKMNYKLLFPTYRNRYLFVQKYLKDFTAKQGIQKALNLGTGEGDYDPMIAPYCHELTACDINEQDVQFAQALNQGVNNLSYAVENALDLSYTENAFDLIISVDVIEHVGQPERMVEEIARVLKPGGRAVVTFPSLDFPLTYDPINSVLSWFTTKKISQGAYAFGHEYLVSKKDFRAWAEKNELKVVEERNLSGYLIGLLEMYWTGIIQRVFKANATNISEQGERKMALRPSIKEPFLSKLTDAIIWFDRLLFKKAHHSVGMGFILEKK